MLKITLKLKIVNHNYWLVCSKNPLFVRIVGYIKIQKNFLKNVKKLCKKVLTKKPVCFIIIYVNKKRLGKSPEFTGSIVERRW